MPVLYSFSATIRPEPILLFFPDASIYVYTYVFSATIRPEPILLFFPPFFLSSNSLFCSIFCSLSSYFSTHKRFFLVYFQLLSMHDCCIRVVHNTEWDILNGMEWNWMGYIYERNNNNMYIGDCFGIAGKNNRWLSPN